MKRAILLTWLWSISLALAGSPMRVVVTLFPLYDWARVIGGDRVEVRMLLPQGAEPHSYAPRPSDIRRLREARVFIYLSPQMEPWANALIRSVRNDSLVVIEAAAGLVGSVGEDPHVWLDPVLAAEMVNTLAEGLARADPEGQEAYRERAARYRDELLAFHQRTAERLRNCRHREILFGGHFAFGYFARRYGLTHRSPYPGFSPDAVPTPRQVAALTDALRETGQKTIFFEELLEPRVARVIAAETGAQLVRLHGLHNLSRDEWRQRPTYLELMDENVEKLRAALECR